MAQSWKYIREHEPSLAGSKSIASFEQILQILLHSCLCSLFFLALEHGDGVEMEEELLLMSSAMGLLLHSIWLIGVSYMDEVCCVVM